MRYRIRSSLITITARMLLAISSLFLAAAQPAHAVVQELSAASLRIEVSAAVLLGDPVPLPPIPLTWNGAGSADVAATSITGLTAGIFSFTGSVPVTDPGSFPIFGLFMAGGTNGVGNFSGVNAASGGGPMAMGGTLSVCFPHPCAGPPANVSVPFTTAGVNGVGLGGAPISATGLVNFTVNSNQWTTGTASVGIFSQTGSPLSGGKVTLVTPTVISTSLGSNVWPSFAIMDLTFIPEPGTALLLGAGVVGLATIGRKRLRRSPRHAPER